MKSCIHGGLQTSPGPMDFSHFWNVLFLFLEAHKRKISYSGDALQGIVFSGMKGVKRVFIALTFILSRYFQFAQLLIMIVNCMWITLHTIAAHGNKRPDIKHKSLDSYCSKHNKLFQGQ